MLCSFLFTTFALLCETPIDSQSLDSAVLSKASALISDYEGLAKCVRVGKDRCGIIVPYPDPGVGEKLYTVCNGHTRLAGNGTGRQFSKNDTFTKAECKEILNEDVLYVHNSLKTKIIVPLNTNQNAAIISFVYNLGERKAKHIINLINSGNFDAVGPQIERYVYAGGKKWKGLERRRHAERLLWEQDI